jgi:hypothetical protein
MRKELLACVLVAAYVLPALAEDFTNELDEARKAYERHDLKTATDALDAAAALLRQERAEQWKAVLPAPLPGWQGEDRAVASAGPAFFGGGTSVGRTYRSGGKTVEVTIVTDSPMMAAMGSMLGGIGGQIMTDDMKTVIVAGRKATFMKSEGSYMTMVSGAMVSVRGSGAATDDDVRAYFNAVRFANIEQMTR